MYIHKKNSNFLTWITYIVIDCYSKSGSASSGPCGGDELAVQCGAAGRLVRTLHPRVHH